MIKARAWNGKDLKGDWQVTLKIDGVRALWSSEGWLSRAGKRLYNIPPPGALLHGGKADCEVYLGNFKDTIRAVRTMTLKPDTPRITQHHLYSLDPLDDRLNGLPYRSSPDVITDPKAATILEALASANRLGYEGLVLRQGETWLKVKPEETVDVLITGAIEGIGKHSGRLGALLTAKGKVGTGFSDKEREDLWARHTDFRLPGGLLPEPVIGCTIEVSCMQFTPDGMFRHPRFVRMRPDKVATE